MDDPEAEAHQLEQRDYRVSKPLGTRSPCADDDPMRCVRRPVTLLPMIRYLPACASYQTTDLRTADVSYGKP
ncbi:MAG: hypothetical protein AMS20_08790 [Gemmatimonas sp. SG8_28]|nr:MAG: hypothetical protein AMS20_08790 [Gemmatimonas sp. SG8_28]